MSEVSTMAPGGPPQIVRLARALLGWMPVEQAERVQHGNRHDVPISEESRSKAAAARAAVADRATGFRQEGVISDAPNELQEYINSLKAHPAAASYFSEGWTVSLVDLRHVVAVQPHVYIEHAGERVRDVDPNNIVSIASVSLPIPNLTGLPAQFDESKNVWLFSAPNPNCMSSETFGHLGG